MPSTPLGTQQVLNKYLLSKQRSRCGATHTAVQIRSCHVGSSGAGSRTLGPTLAQKGRKGHAHPTCVDRARAPHPSPWASPLQKGCTGARTSSELGCFSAVLSHKDQRAEVTAREHACIPAGHAVRNRKCSHQHPHGPPHSFPSLSKSQGGDGTGKNLISTDSPVAQREHH